MTDLTDALAALPGTAQTNLPAVIGPPVWAPERTVTFRGFEASDERHRTGLPSRLVLELPVRRIDTEPLPAGFVRDLETAWATRDAGLVWDLIEKEGIR